MSVRTHCNCEFLLLYLGTCPVDGITNWSQKSCLESYSQENEYREPFYPNQGTSPIQFKQCPLPWVYLTAEELNSSSKWGRHAWYGGGGYLAELGYEEETARTITRLLQSESWVDRQTSAIVVEFSLLNPGTNMLALCSFFVEFLQTGQATVFRKIDTISLYNTDSILQVFQGLCLVFFVAMVFFKLCETLVHVVRQRWRYFTSVWSWLDLGLLFSSILLLMSSFTKSYHTSTSVHNLQQNIFAPVNFQSSVLWTDVENSFLAILTFLTSVKLSQLTYYNMYNRVFARSLRIWMRDLPSFVLVMSVMFLAFLQTGLLLFGSSIGRYSSFWRAFSFQLEITLGKVKARPIKELVNANPIFGHLFVVALLFGITIIMMNFFISTLNDALTEAKTLEVEKEIDEMSKMKLSTSKSERVNSTKENHDDENTAKKTHNTGKQGGKAPKGKNRATQKSSRESNVLFDHVSNQLKANDVKLNLPPLHILDEALTDAKTLEVEKEIDEMSKMKLSTSKPERVNSTKENHDDENTAKKTHNTGKQGGKAPKGKNRAAQKSSRESSVLFDHVSNQVKANDLKLNLPALHILEKKMDEVLKRIDDACSDDINTGGPPKVLKTGKKEKRVQFAGVITVQATVHRDPKPQQEKH